MADMNQILNSIQKQTSEVDASMNKLLMAYEELHKESSRMFREEYTASNNMSGLEDFYRLTQLVRRNRDIVGSMTRGLKNLHHLNEFKFVEEETSQQEQKKATKPKKKKVPEPVQEIHVPEEIASEVAHA